MMSTPRAQNSFRTEYKEFIPRTPHKICSVYPRDVSVENHNGAYIIPAPKEGQEYGFVEVQPGLEKRDFGDGHFASFLTIYAKLVAEDFIGIPQGDTQFTDRGIFVPEGIDPTKEEIAAAREKLMKWAEGQVTRADVTWAQRGSIKDIADDAKAAAKLLKLERDWADSWKAKEVMACPACGEAVNKNARIHAVGQGGCGERIYWTEDGNPYWPETEKPGPKAEAVPPAPKRTFSPPPGR